MQFPTHSTTQLSPCNMKFYQTLTLTRAHTHRSRTFAEWNKNLYHDCRTFSVSHLVLSTVWRRWVVKDAQALWHARTLKPKLFSLLSFDEDDVEAKIKQITKLSWNRIPSEYVDATEWFAHSPLHARNDCKRKRMFGRLNAHLLVKLFVTVLKTMACPKRPRTLAKLSMHRRHTHTYTISFAFALAYIHSYSHTHSHTHQHAYYARKLYHVAENT